MLFFLWDALNIQSLITKQISAFATAKFAAFFAIVLWASSFVGIRAALDVFSPGSLALLRYLIASLCMTIFFLSLNSKQVLKKDFILLLLIGVIGISVYNLALGYAEESVSSGIASFIVSQSPLITTIIAIFLLGEKLTWVRSLGFGISMVGLVLIASGEKTFYEFNNSLIYIFVATLASGLYSACQKTLLNKYNAILATTYIIWGGTLGLLIYLPALYQDLQKAPTQSILVVAYLGIFPAALGYIAWNYALARLPATRVVSFLYLMPFIATLIGWIWLSEIPAFISLFGGMIAILGVWLVNYSYQAKKFNPVLLEHELNSDDTCPEKLILPK